MKKFYLILSVFLFSPLSGLSAPWGILEEAVSARDYGVDKLLARESIRYAVSQEITPQEEQAFLSNLRKWPQETLKFIRKSGREQEFRDVVPVLEQKLTFEKVQTAKEADVSLEMNRSGLCRELAAGCFDPESHRIAIAPSQRDSLVDICLHEVGHYYGMGDQYEEARDKAHRNYSSNANDVQGSIMQYTDSTGGKITCDDADGFINLIDLRTSQNTGRFSSRSANGWKSLCSPKVTYKKAKTLNRDYDRIQKDEQNEKSVQYDSEGNAVKEDWDSFLTDENLFPLFAVSPKDRIVSAAEGLVARVESYVGTPVCPLPKQGGPAIREFKYVQESKDIYKVHIRCLHGTKEVKKYSFPVVHDPEWTLFTDEKISAARPAQTIQFPFDGTYSLSVEFSKFRLAKVLVAQSQAVGGQIVAARMTCPLAGESFKVELETPQAYNYEIAARDFQKFLTNRRVPQEHRTVVSEMKQVCDKNIANISSFYRNFYQPLFGINTGLTDAELRQKVGRLFGR